MIVYYCFLSVGEKDLNPKPPANGTTGSEGAIPLYAVVDMKSKQEQLSS